MATAASIPDSIANSVISRWINGQSAGAIVDWIHSSNSRRKTPTTTSKSSVTRFIERYASSQGLGNTIPVVRRCRAEASRMLDGLDDVQDEFRACLARCDTLEATPEARHRFSARMRLLTNIERTLFRRLKLAGIDGKTPTFHDERKCEGLDALDARFRADAEEDLKVEFGLSTGEKSHRLDSENTTNSWRNDPVACMARPPPPGSFQEMNKDLKVMLDITERSHGLKRNPPARPMAMKEQTPEKQEVAAPPKVPVHVEPKVGRNEPCPCGSGKKFKKCHDGVNPPMEKKAA